MTEKQINTVEELLKQNGVTYYAPEMEAIRCRKMINSILIYHYKPSDADFSFPQPNLHLNEFAISLGWNGVKCLWDEQVKDFKQAQTGYAGQDFEGCNYNYCKWADD